MNDDFKKITQLQEYDRKRIASDLHDTSLQTLAHITHQIELASMYMDKDIIRAKLELADINKELHDVIDEIRETIFDLRPMSFDDLGLKETIESLIASVNSKSDISYKLTISDINIESDLDKLQIYRIIQELVRNCEKHSKAKNVNINIYQSRYEGTPAGSQADMSKVGSWDDQLHMIIEDDGIGMNVEDIPGRESNHFGISIIKERLLSINGTVDIESDIDRGTKVRISVPV